MTLTQRLTREYKRMSSALSAQPTTWHHCPHCEEQTPWVVRLWSGYFRCMTCGNDPLDANTDAARSDRPPRRPDRAGEADRLSGRAV